MQRKELDAHGFVVSLEKRHVYVLERPLGAGSGPAGPSAAEHADSSSPLRGGAKASTESTADVVAGLLLHGHVHVLKERRRQNAAGRVIQSPSLWTNSPSAVEVNVAADK